MGLYTSENTNFFDWIFSAGGIISVAIMVFLVWLVLKIFDKAEDKFKKPKEQEPPHYPKYEQDMEKFFSDDIGETTIPPVVNSGYNIESSQEMYFESVQTSDEYKTPLSEEEEMEVIANNIEEDEGMRIADESKISEKRDEMQ